MTWNMPVAQHQNGFIKVALPLGGRLHVWSPWNPPVPDGAEVHDHPFAFSSLVLAGEMVNVRLRDEDDAAGEWVEHGAECVTSFGPQPGLVGRQRRVHLVGVGVDFVRRGELYAMPPWELHRTDAVFALTLFRKGRQEEGHSRVFVRREEGMLPFAPTHENLLRLSVDRALRAAHLTMDDVVAIEAAQHRITASDHAVKTLPRASSPGYHLREIPRSPHGSVGKVVEEALELADAVEQGVKVMALCECADVVTALKGYLEREHAGTKWDDVVKMADVTARAFSSGRRREVL